MKSNLLILDEPTDGFSKEQLGNVREVLDEVGCPQVIIVSHDKELESFADQIFRVDKAGSDSVVGNGTPRVASLIIGWFWWFIVFGRHRKNEEDVPTQATA